MMNFPMSIQIGFITTLPSKKSTPILIYISDSEVNFIYTLTKTTIG